MKNRSSARSVFLSALVVLTAAISPLSAASAATKPKAQPVANQNASTLKISPLRSDVTIDPGSSKKVEVTAFNTTSSAIALKAIENDFVAGDEKGTPAVILDENSYAPTHSLKRFMVPVPNVTVPANSSAIVPVTITVPASAQAGGYFGALRFAPAGSSDSAQVNLGISVVSLILLTVPGPTTENLQLTNFDIQQNGGTGSNFRTPNALTLFLRFQNKGNLQEAPFGLVYVQKGKKVVYTYKFNQTDPKAEILPDSYRRWTVPLKGLGKFGKYKVAATIGYGTKGQTINIEKSVWIIPTGYILIAAGIIVFLILSIGGFTIFIRSYKRRILRNSRRRY